ncbi:MAG: class I SAM-dependent methyltransferase [Nitrospirae bacterium]|nr:MAG: class I SAM-dependent methyltransferase [Nitrospirota bacterium]
MERRLEPQLMDDYAQAKAYAEADFQEVNQGFVDRFRQYFKEEEIRGPVIDLGCGPADISIRFARAYPEAEVYAIDGSGWMLHFAEKLLVKEDETLKERVHLVKAIIPKDPLPVDGAVAIISNSLLHHLPEPMVLWETVKRYSRPDTLVFIMDLLRPESPEKAWQIVETYSSEEPDILKRDFFNSLCAAFTPEEIKDQLSKAGLPLQVDVVSDRHLLVWGKL